MVTSLMWPLHFECDHYILNVKFWIHFKKFYKFHSVGVLSQDTHQVVNKKNSSSLILTNKDLRFEPYVPTPFGSDVQKTQNKGNTIYLSWILEWRGYCKIYPKKKNFDVWMLWCHGFYGMMDCNVLRFLLTR
jgi:hypothetical protein